MRTNEELRQLIDWDAVLKVPRYAGGCESILVQTFGDRAEFLASWNEGEYQGTCSIALRMKDDQSVIIMCDYYGSCSGCDAWEDSSDEDARKMIGDHVQHCKIFADVPAAIAWLENIDSTEKPWEYPWDAAVHMLDGLRGVR